MHVHYTENITPIKPADPIFLRFAKILAGILFVLLLLTALVVGYVLHQARPPVDFPTDVRVTIEDGSSVSEIVSQLSESGYVRSENLLYFALVALNDPTTIKASTYRFKEPIDVFELARRLTEGDFGIDLERFVHYEGERVTQIAERAAENLVNFDAETFRMIALPLEGRLFPDTYLIPETYTPEELKKLMVENYESRVGPLRPAISRSEFTEDEVLILASIIEREANTRDSKRIVSGILQKRLEIGMPLQVDAVFEYILNKSGTELTKEDLQVESPYNTYLNTGLPPTPIGNPGLESIEAVLEPEPSPYLYYITGRDGNFYYASTYEQHQSNVNTYLR